MGDPQIVRAAWHELGRRLFDRRQAAGLSQKALGTEIQYNRSSIGNIEIGLQHVDRSFWEKADARLDAGGELVRGYDAAESLQRAHQRPEASPSAAHGKGHAVNLASAPTEIERDRIILPATRALPPNATEIECGEWNAFSRVTAILAQQRQSVSPQALLSLVEAHRDCLSTLFRQANTDPLRAEIGAMLGEASIVASRLWSAQGNRTLALAHCVYARQLADRLGIIRVSATARIFESNLQSDAATLIGVDGDIMIGLRLLEEAAAASDYLSPAAKARIAAEQAQAYAALKLPHETQAALDRAGNAGTAPTLA